jgi:hypothetical protein
MAVYFTRLNRDGSIKIGFTVDVASRMDNIRSSVDGGIELLAVDYDGDLLTESELHWRFRGQALGRELFVPTDDLYRVVRHVERAESVPNGWYLPKERSGWPWISQRELREKFGVTLWECCGKGADINYMISNKTVPAVVDYLRRSGVSVTYQDILVSDVERSKRAKEDKRKRSIYRKLLATLAAKKSAMDAVPCH